MWANLWVKVRRLSGATAQKVQDNFRTEMETALHIIAAFPALSLIERNRHIELSRSGARRFHCEEPQREGGPGRLQHRPESGALFRHGRTCGCRGTRSSCRGTWCRASLAPTRRAARMHCSSSYKLIDEEPQLTCGLLPPMPLPLIAALASATAVPRIARGARQDAVRR